MNLPTEIINAYKDVKHVHGRRCMRTFGNILYPGEETILEVKQSYLASIAPDRIIVTDRRIIIVRPSFWGLYIGKNIISPTEVSVVPYKNVISVVMLKGRILSTINMRIHGFTDAHQSIRNEGIMNGIRSKHTIKMVNLLEDIIESREESGIEEYQKTQSQQESKYAMSLSEAKEKVKMGSSFVWLGLEPKEYIAHILNTDPENIVKRDPKELQKIPKEELEELKGAVLLCYTGMISESLADYLKEEHDIDAYSLKGGVLNLINNRKSARYPKSFS